MKTLITALVILGAAVTAYAEVTASLANRVRSMLENGSTVVVDYRAGGCFGCDMYKLEIVSAKDSPLAVNVFSITEHKDGSVSCSQIATVTLTDRDRDRFDRLLDYYLVLPTNSCSTASHYDAFREASKKESFFTIEDDTGATVDKLESLTFGEIVERAGNAEREAKKANQALLPTSTAVTPAASHPSRQP